jgi:pimeloyl-ACP methyl ester carboxylesterase
MVQPTMKIRLRNQSGLRLYYALLALSELYGISSLLPGGGVWLDPGEEAFVPGSDGRTVLYLDVPRDQERTTDVLKLIVTTEEFDAQQLDQDDLRPPTRLRGAEATGKGISTRPELPAEQADWSTAEISVTTVRPAEFRNLGAEEIVPLGPGIVMLGHPALRARVRLVSRPLADREATVSLLPPLLVDQPGITEPYAFSATRVPGSELSVLELADVAGTDTISPDEPLIIQVDGVMEPGELVLPIAFDGQDYLPVGYSRADDRQVEIRITMLPSPSEELARSLGGSLKILFRKLVLRPLGLGYDYPHLSLVTFEADGQARYDNDAAHVRAAIDTAQRLLLLVHGIIGDTRGMAAAIARTEVLGGYDALLAFDYENINTPIPETARALAERLCSVGLTSDNGRHVDILAHSMGGLVSRWFIEREEGAGLVRHLVVCGTPNGGSPWSTVGDLATSTLALALNGAAALSGPLAVVGAALSFLVQAVERVDVTLDSMSPGSDLLTVLSASAQPPVPYAAVAGRDPFGPAAQASRARVILEKVRIPKLVLDAVFAGIANDLAVSVSSATTFGSSWAARPPQIEVDCNHLTYFASADGMTAVRRALSWHDS